MQKTYLELLMGWDDRYGNAELEKDFNGFPGMVPPDLTDLAYPACTSSILIRPRRALGPGRLENTWSAGT